MHTKALHATFKIIYYYHAYAHMECACVTRNVRVLHRVCVCYHGKHVVRGQLCEVTCLFPALRVLWGSNSCSWAWTAAELPWSCLEALQCVFTNGRIALLFQNAKCFEFLNKAVCL